MKYIKQFEFFNFFKKKKEIIKDFEVGDIVVAGSILHLSTPNSLYSFFKNEPGSIAYIPKKR